MKGPEGLIPGRLHALILSTTPLSREYVRIENVMIDKNIRDYGVPILNAIKDRGYTHISLFNDNMVFGRSWEMSAAKLLLDIPGVFSGTVEDYKSPNVFKFGIVPGIDVKKEVYKNVITV